MGVFCLKRSSVWRWRVRVAVFAMLALVLQPLLPAALSHASEKPVAPSAESALKADLLFTCLAGHSGYKDPQKGGDQDAPELPSCPWCVVKSFGKSLALATQPASLPLPSISGRLGWPAKTADGTASHTDFTTQPRAPPSRV